MRMPYLVPLLVSLALLAGAARADSPAISQRTASSNIGGGMVALAVATGAGFGAMGALVAGEALLTVGAGTVVAIYVGHLILEAIVVAGAVYVWPDSEDSVEPVRRPPLKFKRAAGPIKLRLVATH